MAQEQPRRATQVRGQGRQPGGTIPRPRTGAAAERSYPTSEVRGSGREELPHVRGQRQQPGGATPRPRSGAAAKRSYSTPEARGSGCVDQPHIQGAVAAWAQEGLEELFHLEGQEVRQ